MGERFAFIVKGESRALEAVSLKDVMQETRQSRSVLSLPAIGWIARLLDFILIVSVSEVAAVLVTSGLEVDLAADYGRVTLVAAIVYLLLADALEVNDVEAQLSVRRSWGRVLMAWSATFFILVTLGFVLKMSADFSRGWALAWVGGSALALMTSRLVVTRLTFYLKRRGSLDHRVAIYGASDQGERLAAYIRNHGKLTLRMVGFYDDRQPARLGSTSLPLRGTSTQLISDIREGLIDQVIIALPWSADRRLREVVEPLAMTPVRIRLAPDVASFIFASRPVVLLGDVPVMTLFERPISGFDQAAKWLEDMILGLLFTLLAIPIMLVIALAIRLDSPGPIFFRQQREGFNNRLFEVFKFRTMYADRCERDSIVQARRDDGRVTRVGTILRRTSLDELPQLFNVLLGHMSLVGPRPHAASTRAGDRVFSDVVASYAARHRVKPGMTGWAQVCGWRGETRDEQALVKRLEHDLHYIENWSLWLDLYILIRTVGTVLMQKTAY